MNAFMRFISRGLPMRFKPLHVRVQASTPGSVTTAAENLQPGDRIILPSRSKTHVVTRVERLSGYLLAWAGDTGIAFGYEEPLCIIRPSGLQPTPAPDALTIRARKIASEMGESWAHHPVHYVQKLNEPRGI